MKQFARLVSTGCVLLFFGCFRATGADITTRWVGGSFTWSTASNWDNGVPNNSGGNTYTAVIDLMGARVIPNISGLQITNLQLLEGQIESTSSTGSFTVRNETTIDPAKNTDMFSQTMPAARFRIIVSGGNKVTYNLGNFTGVSAGTLLGGRYELTSRSATSEAFVAWPGAAISTIGRDAEVLLSDVGPAGFRNSLDNSDALAGVTRNEGIFRMAGRGFAFSGSFTNTGEFAINKAIALGPSTDLIEFKTIGDFANEGDATIQSNSSMTSLRIGGNFTNSGTLLTTLSNFSGLPQTLTPTIVGNLVNTGLLTFRADNQKATWNINGTVQNTNEINLDANTADLTVHATGGFADFAGGTLGRGTYRLLASEPGGFATLSAPGTDIHAIGANATIALEGTGASFLNTSSSLDALKDLARIDGAFRVVGQNRALAGGFANHGILEFRSTSEFGSKVLSINGGFSNTGDLEVGALNVFGQLGGEVIATALGALAQNVGGVLTAGSLTVDADLDASAILEWLGADIDAIAGGAGVTLRGPGSRLRDRATMADALAGLSSNAGRLWFDTRNGAAPGNFVNDNGAGEPAVFLVSDATFAIGGSFANGDETHVRASEAPASLTVASGISNPGVFEVAAFDANAIASASGPLAEQVGMTLQAGEIAVSAHNGRSAIFEYNGANVATIAREASVKIDGPGAEIRDKLGGLDALRSIENVQGLLRLNDGKSRVTPGALSVSGEFDLRSANFRVSGDFNNTGNTFFNFAGSAGKVMIIDGAFSNPGELVVYSGGTVTTNSPLPQQSGTTLSEGGFDAFGGVIAWNGAAINRIGADATIELRGASSAIRNSSNSANALSGLVSNEGHFILDGHTFAFAGDFDNPGETDLIAGVTLVMNPGRMLRSSGGFEVGGINTLTGGTLELLAGGYFAARDYFVGFGPEFEPIYAFAKFSAPEIRIAGELYLELFDLEPDAAAEYTILESAMMTGAFKNVAFGERVNVFNGYKDRHEEVMGSFKVNFDSVSGRVYLTDFKPASVGGVGEIRITHFELAGNEAALFWTVSDGGGADVYFSPDLDNWGSPVATGVVTGNYTHLFQNRPREGFFTVVAQGTGPPP